MNPQPDQNQKQDTPATYTNAQAPLDNRLAADAPEHSSEGSSGAANAARYQAEHIYDHNPPNQLTGEDTQTEENPYKRTHQPTFDWQRYHTAWQSYYQQYYERYYLHQLYNLRVRQEHDKLLNQPSQPEESIVGQNEVYAPKTRFEELRRDLLGKVANRARKLQKSDHFVAIACVLVLIFLFLFLQFNRLIVAQVEQYISPASTAGHDTIIVDPASNAGVSSDPRLIIPKVNVNVPVIYTVTTVDEKVIQKALESGVVHYNLPGAGSVPGQAGNTVILGHSSNDVFDPGDYKFTFVLIDRLQPGDLFYMNYQSKRYAYKVTQKKIISPSDWRVLQQNSGEPTVILVTGTPAGTATDRLLVYGEQVSPSPSTASAQPTNKEDSNPGSIPGNSLTFFERLTKLFFP